MLLNYNQHLESNLTDNNLRMLEISRGIDV